MSDDHNSSERESGSGEEGARTDLLADESRRRFFKRIAAGGGAALLGGGAVYAASSVSLDGALAENYPETNGDFKPFDQKDTVLSHTVSPLLRKRMPERQQIFNELNDMPDGYDWHEIAQNFEHNVPYDPNKPGFTQLDGALQHAAWAPWIDHGEFKGKAVFLSGAGVPRTPPFSWDQSTKHAEKHKFKNSKEAADAIRSAARLFGALRVGFAHNDPRWNYDPIYDLTTDEELTWEKDFPFKPKSVIVMVLPMDYDAMATAPSRVSSAAAAMGYTMMAVVAGGMKHFMNGLGYNAVGAGNDLAISPAYGIMAGLGEGGRNNCLLVPGYGPRVRICKVFTDFDFEDQYDQPRTWGIAEFCKSCKKCAEACPSQAISLDDEPTFEPVHELAANPGYNWNNHVGVKKFHNDPKRCVTFWLEVDGDCGACIASCTFNEPDVWHHWFIMAINPIMPRMVHGLMAELHPAFGYGSTENPEKVKKFWKTGKGMRVNKHNKHNYGTSNVS
jgi:reductive dehalogenase